MRRWWVLLVTAGCYLVLGVVFSFLYGPWASIGPLSAAVVPAFASGYLFGERRRQLGVPFDRPFYRRRSAGSAS